MKLVVLNIILIIIIIWYSYMELIKFECKNKIYMEKLLDRNFKTSNVAYNINTKNTILKTGDIILFKSIDNINSSLLINHFTHIGLVIVDKVLTNNEPYIFEACATLKMNIPYNRPNTWNTKFDKGILFHPLYERLKKYNGYTYYKPLSKALTYSMKISLINFIFYALNNMEYNYNIVHSIFQNVIIGKKCNNETNCGELVFLSLINAGLLDNRLWHKRTIHYLKWMSNIINLKNLYNYKPIVEIVKIAI